MTRRWSYTLASAGVYIVGAAIGMLGLDLAGWATWTLMSFGGISMALYLNGGKR